MSLVFFLIGALCIALLSWKKPFGILILLSLCLVLGEFSRIDLPIGPRGILLSDVLVPFFVGIYYLRSWATHKALPTSAILLPLTLFTFLNIGFLLFSPLHLTTNDLVTAGLYLVRFTSYLLLIPVVKEIANKNQTKTIILLLITGFCVAILGFLQLQFYPDFKEMAQIGWDPHINRLLSTWFDPNFVGGFLGMIATIGLGMLLVPSVSKRNKIWIALLLLVLLYALFVTYSRSGYLLFAGAAAILLLIRNPKVLLGLCIGVACVLPLSERAFERVQDLYSSAISLFSSQTNSYEHNLDPTAQFRVQSWLQTLSIFEKYPIHAIGYNTLKNARLEEGFEKDPDSHAATGADSSLLLILATTGILGTSLFLWIFGTLLQTSWRLQKLPGIEGMYNTIVIALAGGLLIHSTFVNSLFFPFILLTFALLVGVAHAPKNSERLP